MFSAHRVVRRVMTCLTLAAVTALVLPSSAFAAGKGSHGGSGHSMGSRAPKSSTARRSPTGSGAKVRGTGNRGTGNRGTGNRGTGNRGTGKTSKTSNRGNGNNKGRNNGKGNGRNNGNGRGRDNGKGRGRGNGRPGVIVLNGIPTFGPGYDGSDDSGDSGAGYTDDSGDSDSSSGDLYAAIAYSPSTGQYGYATRCASQDDAQNMAINACNADDAQVVTWTKNAFCALAVGSDGSFGGAWSDAQDDAEGQAAGNCSADANTQVVASINASEQT